MAAKGGLGKGLGALLGENAVLQEQKEGQGSFSSLFLRYSPP